MKKILIFSFPFLLSNNLLAEENEKTKPSDFYKKSISIVETYQNNFSNYMYKSAYYIDDYWKKSEQEEYISKEDNKSFGIFKMGTSYSSKDNLDAQIRMKLKYHLPNMKKNMNLFFDINDDTNETLSSKSNIIKNNHSEDKLSGGVVYEKNKGKWRRNYKIGAKISFPFNPFIKAEIYRDKTLADNLNLFIKQEAFYYKEEGLGAATHFDFQYNLKNNDYLGASYTIQYLKEEQWELFSNYTYFKNINNKNSLKYSIGAIKKEDNNIDNVRYWTNIRWRHQLHKEWLFLKVTPEISFENIYDYSAEYKVLLELEMFFGTKKGIKKGIKKYRYR